MGLFKSILGKKQAPVAPPGAVVDNSMGLRPMRQQPRPSLVVGGPAYFTPEGYEAPRQPEQAFMPTDRMPDPIGEQFRRERPTLPPMPPAITGTDLGLPMNPGIPAPGGVEMGQPFRLPGRLPTGDTSFLDFFNQQGMGNVDIPPLPVAPRNDFLDGMSNEELQSYASKMDHPYQQAAETRLNEMMTSQLGFDPKFGQPKDRGADYGFTPLNIPPISQAIAGRTPGQYSIDPREGVTNFDPLTAFVAQPPVDSGPGGRADYGFKVSPQVKQKPIVPIPNASPVTPEQVSPPIEQIEQIKQIIPQLPPEQLQEVLPQLPPEVIQQVIPQLPPEVIEQIKSQLPPEIIQQLQLFNPQVSMPSPMMPQPPMMPAPPAMMPREITAPGGRYRGDW